MTQAGDDLAAGLGIAGVTSVTALQAGRGGNDLWRLERADGDLVVRSFPPGAPPLLAERESQAHRYAIDHGLSVPEVHSCQVLDGRSYLVMDHVAGVRVADALWSGADADDLGSRSGVALATLHAVADPPPPLIAARSWLDWPGPMPDLRPVLEPYDIGARVLHLDFHPENLIIAPDGRITVLDWANCVIGPPSADLARTLSILELIMDAVPDLPGSARQAAAVFRDGMLAGYRQAGGDDTVPDPVRAWAYAAQRRDLADSWVPSWYLDRLEERCRALIAGQNIP
jgi:aminoglycoside phosphotransferase (APT) family kinase protein